MGGPVDGQPEKSGDHNELAGAGSFKDFWWSRGESSPFTLNRKNAEHLNHFRLVLAFMLALTL